MVRYANKQSRLRVLLCVLTLVHLGSTQTTIYPVTNLADSGPGSFREAVATAMASTSTGNRLTRTITFAEDLEGTLTLQSAIVLNKPATVIGNKAVVITVAGEGLFTGSECVSVSRATVLISGLEFRGCPQAISVFKSTSVIIEECTATGSAGSAESQAAFYFSSSSSCHVRRCFVGVRVVNGVTQVPEVANAANGITFSEGNANQVYDCVISGNQHNGIYINADSAHFHGNKIGTDADGLTAVPNVRDGISLVFGSSPVQSLGIVIGGSESGHRNIISGNLRYGVQLNRRTAIIENNWIGVNANGEALGNVGGIFLYLRSENMRLINNVISGNIQNGVYLQGQNSFVTDNLIGWDPTGELPVPNGASSVRTELNFYPSTIEGNYIYPNLAFSNTAMNIINNTLGYTKSGKIVKLKGAAISGLGRVIKDNSIAGFEVGIAVNVENTLVEGNSICACAEAGIQVTASDATLHSNRVGISRQGDACGGSSTGILVRGDDAAVGSLDVDSGNTVAHNSIGISVEKPNVIMLANSVYANLKNYASLNGPPSSPAIMFDDVSTARISGSVRLEKAEAHVELYLYYHNRSQAAVCTDFEDASHDQVDFRRYLGRVRVATSESLPTTVPFELQGMDMADGNTVVGFVQHESSGYISRQSCMSLCIAEEEYEESPPTSSSDRLCQFPSQCSVNEFETSPPTSTSDRKCQAHTECVGIQEELVAPTATSDRVCDAKTRCSPDQYETVAPTISTDRECAQLTICPPGTYESAPPLANRDRQCEPLQCPTAVAISSDLDFDLTCPQGTNYSLLCDISCPNGMTLVYSEPFVCQHDSETDTDKWVGSLPICFEYIIDTTTSVSLFYESGFVRHNADTHTTVFELDPALQFLTTLNSGLLSGLVLDNNTGTHNMTVSFTFEFARQYLNVSTANTETTVSIEVSPRLTAPNSQKVLERGSHHDGQGKEIIGGLPPLVYSLSSSSIVPPGLSFDTATGALTGLPSTTGTYVLGIQVTDGNGQVLSLPPDLYQVRSTLTVPWTRQGPIPTPVLGESFNLPAPAGVISGSNAVGSLVFFVEGQLPDGVRLDEKNGDIFGVPTNSSTFTFRLFVKDQAEIPLLLEEVTLQVLEPLDCSIDANGPNGQGCNGGVCVDLVDRDQTFTCNCSSTTFTGDNCELAVSVVQKSTDSSLLPYFGVAGGLFLVMLVVMLVALKRRQAAIRAAKRPFDFEAEVERLREEGLLRSTKVPREISRRKIKLLEKLGEGQFGDVFKGSVNEYESTGVPEYLAAVKQLKKDPSGEQKAELLQEAATMAQFNHPNVVNLIGVCTAGPPVLMVVQFCEHGALNLHLRQLKEDGNALAPMRRIRFCYDIALGMRYLSEKGLVHRDLAARNVLLDSSLSCKVADFGLSRDMDNEQYYRPNSNGMVPVRWTAPEALAELKYSTKSDVWAYGIVIHEIFTDAELPYKSMKNQAVWLEVRNGYRLPRARQCPVELYDNITLPAWDLDPAKRPTFQDVVQILEKTFHVKQETEALKRECSKHAEIQSKGLMPEDESGYVDFANSVPEGNNYQESVPSPKAEEHPYLIPGQLSQGDTSTDLTQAPYDFSDPAKGFQQFGSYAMTSFNKGSEDETADAKNEYMQVGF